MNTIESKQIRDFGKFRLDTEQKVLWHDGEIVSMSLKPLEMLCLLVENEGRLVTKNELIDKIWADSFVEENNLSRHIYLLRKTLTDFGADKNLIENVPRRGYRFTGEVRTVPTGEIIVEKHTRTQTLIEFEEEKTLAAEPEQKTGFLQHVLSASRSRPAVSLALAAILLVGVFGFSSYRGRFFGAPSAEITSIAVLPFKTIDAGPESRPQGLGLTDILITRLSNIREIKVRPTAAVISFENEDSVSAGQKLKTDAVLEGTIYRVGEKTRVTARLVKVSDGATLWNGQFEQMQTDELRVQNEIALQVTDALRLRLSSSEKDALAKRFTENPDAFELYTRGRLEWNKRTWARMLEAERLFRNAIDRDPNFALAYVGLADAIMMGSNWFEAEMAIDKALELDPKLAEAYATRGFMRTFQYQDWPAAESAFQKSIELSPNYATAHHWLAQVLAIQGRHEEAKAAMHRALEINPLSHNFLADLGQIYYFNREYEKAEEYCRRALEIYPDFEFAHLYLYQIYLKTGRYERAVEEIIAAGKIGFSFANQSAKRQKEIEEFFDRERKSFREGGIKKFMEKRTAESADPNLCFHAAWNNAFLGEREKALSCLEKAAAAKAFHSVFIKADPIFDELRDEPRYREILRKMNLH